MTNKWNIKLFIKHNKEKLYKCTMVVLTLIIALLSVVFYNHSKLITSSTTDVVNLVAGDFKAYDSLIAIYIEGEESQTFPSKGDGYILDNTNSYCDNAIMEWDNDKWGLLTTNMTKRTKCYLYFIQGSLFKSTTVEEFITNLLSTSSEVIKDETDDKNIRYIGADPNNYVWFNCEDYSNPTEETCERWRIIGLMNNVSTDNGTESLVKIVRASIIGNYAWDKKEDGTYNNTWDTSTIKFLLNDTYYNNGTSTQYYSTIANAYTITAAFDGTGDTKGITSATKNLIQEVNWNVTAAAYNVTALTYYTTTGLTSKYNIGLIDPSDYGFATDGGTKTRKGCLNETMRYGDGYWNGESQCYGNSWLYYTNPTSSNTKGSYSMYWTNRPYTGDTNSAMYVFSGDDDMYFNPKTYFAFGVRPALYLSSDINILEDNTTDGSYASPYRIS